MDLTLHRMTRCEVIEVLEKARKDIEKVSKDKKIDVELYAMSRNGEKQFPFMADVVDGRLTVLTIEKYVLAIAPFMGSKLHQMSVDELIAALKSFKNDDIQMNRTSAVGKVLYAEYDNCVHIVLIPVPLNIEEVNKFVDDVVARSCERARSGGKCGTCTILLSGESCEHLDRASGLARRKFDPKYKERVNGDEKN